MAEIKNIQCACCGEYIPADSAVCSFCGEAVSKAMEEEPKDDNVVQAEQVNADSAVESEEVSPVDKGEKIHIVVISLLAFICAVGIGFFILDKLNPNITLFNSEEGSQKVSTAIPQSDKSDKASGGIENAKKLFNQENYDEAAEIFQEEINKNNNPVALYYMAEIYNKRDYTKLAIRYYKKADNEKTNFYEPKKRLAEIYWVNDEDDLAVKYAEEAYKIKSNDVELMDLLFRMYNYSDETDKAIAMCKAIVKIDSKHYNANYYLANYYYKNDNYRETIPYLENLLKAEYNTQLSYTLALCYAHIEYYTKSIEVLDRIIDKDPAEADYASYLKSNVKGMREQYRLEHKPKNSTPKQLNDNSHEKGLESSVEDALF